MLQIVLKKYINLFVLKLYLNQIYIKLFLRLYIKENYFILNKLNCNFKYIEFCLNIIYTSNNIIKNRSHVTFFLFIILFLYYKYTFHK